MNNTQKTSAELPKELSPARSTHRRRLFIWVLGITVFLLLSIIVSQQLWLWRFFPDTASDTLLLYALSTLNFVAFVVFSFIFVRNLLKLRLERRERQLGSKIKTRLLVYFIAISFLPIIAMAVFSYLFLNRSLEKWFGRLPAQVVNEAQEVQREAVDAQLRNLRDTASLLAAVLNPQSDHERQLTLDRVVANGQISAVEIVDANGGVIAGSKRALPPDAAAEVNSLLKDASAPGVTDVANLADGKDFDVVSVRLADNRRLIVVPLRRATSDLGETISGSQGEYEKLVARQRRVRSLGLSTLGLMTLLLLFVSSWVAIYLARGISTPIRALAEASNEIARGNLSHRVTTIAEDELAMLADSFNQMTTQLEDNRTSIEAGSAALREKNLTLEERRNYIETVLESLSTGVISLDENDSVTTINAAASRMLQLSAPVANLKQGRETQRLPDLIGGEDWLVLDRVLRRARRTGQSAEQAQLTGNNKGAPLPVALNATALGAASTEKRGVVLVLEDLSELLAAQRVAAWSEVARRMAHEIKNPLTPIQLSAERIAKSYRRALNGDQNGQNGTGSRGERTAEEQHVSAVIDECTDTIAREVAGLKAMVDEFSRFARLPLAKLEAANLNEVIRQAVALYDDRLDEVSIGTELDAALPNAMLDSEQLRRVFVNLIDNANNAMADIHGDRLINVTTRFDSGRSLLVAEVSDTGHGIRPDDFKRLFQPYFSTRGSGTGLGLAIVQRIIMEHGGRIRAEVNYPRGARFVIELPAMNA